MLNASCGSTSQKALPCFSYSTVIWEELETIPGSPNLTGSIWVVYLFHMPLFFMLSGLTFHPNKDFRTFFISRFKRLVIPYFFFSIYALGKILLLIVAPSVVQGFHAGAMGTPLSEIGVILLGNTNGLWFFLTLFWGELFLYGVNKLTK